MNNIQIRQNESENLRLLAAQRQLYSEAKKRLGWRTAIAVALLIYAIVGAIYDEELNMLEVPMAIVGVAFMVATYAFLRKRENQRVETAARVQQQFDSAVLDLPSDPLKIERPTQEIIVLKAAQRHLANFNIKADTGKEIDALPESEWKRMRLWEWYEVPSNIPANNSALFCQKSNLLWDQKQRKWYMGFFLALTILSVVIPLCLAWYLDLSTGDYIVKLLSLSLPLVLICLDNYHNHKDISQSQTEMADTLEAILKRGDTVSPEVLRKTQDIIFENRKKPTLVPDALYWYLRQPFQKDMETDAELHSSES